MQPRPADPGPPVETMAVVLAHSAVDLANERAVLLLLSKSGFHSRDLVAGHGPATVRARRLRVENGRGER